ncbi:hypothetical protein GJ744_011522 [Endocarpon pusillum]|uniref:Uncharacterized protein n=1 Tax=Endocarpon pusillum TaxID=364733 RepID=A0A8H7AD69_9EURO|nr:hypothetical protein GJ744_011522 [Endocarpon pusillum]
MIAEASTLVDPKSIHRGSCGGYGYRRHRGVISEVKMRKEVEPHPSSVIVRCHMHWVRQKGRPSTPDKPSSGDCYGYRDGVFDREQVGEMISKLLDERIQFILRNWDRYAVEDPAMMDDLQAPGCSSSDTSAVRDLVESFASLDSTTAPQPDDYLIDQLWADDPPSINFSSLLRS